MHAFMPQPLVGPFPSPRAPLLAQIAIVSHHWIATLRDLLLPRRGVRHEVLTGCSIDVAISYIYVVVVVALIVVVVVVGHGQPGWTEERARRHRGC